jgi:hypothetical protein
MCKLRPPKEETAPGWHRQPPERQSASVSVADISASYMPQIIFPGRSDATSISIVCKACRRDEWTLDQFTYTLHGR